MKKIVSATPSKLKVLDHNKENQGINPSPCSTHSVQKKKPGHRKSSSYQPNCTDVFPYKSRFDSDYIPVLVGNHSVLKSETCQFNSFMKKSENEDQRIRQIEWFKAKKKMKKIVENDVNVHECKRNAENSEFRKELIRKNEKSRRLEHSEKIEDFVEFNQAKKSVLQYEKVKDKEYLDIEREKSLKRQKEIQEKKTKLAQEREEKRKNFLETLAAKKQIKSSEKNRESKEFHYDVAIHYLGERNLALSKTSFK